jgi:xylulokinase
LISDAAGTREQFANWWLKGLEDCLAGFDTVALAAVRAVAVSGQQHGFVPLAADGEVLAPVKLWCDTATQAECDEIASAFGGQQRCLEEAGNAILPGYTAPKIRWLRNNRPDAYARLATVLLPHDYINYVLTGECVMEYGDASGTGLLDIRQRRWHEGLLQALDAERDLAPTLPPLVGPGQAIGQVTAPAAQRFKLPAGIPVATGGGDNMMAAIGTGNVSSGRVTVSLGTSGTLFASSATPVTDPSGEVAAFCSSTGGWLPLLCTMNCTVSTELTRDLFNMPVDDLSDVVSAVPRGSNGVVTVPFFNGERSPNLPRAKGCLFGLDEGNYSRENLLRSAMESAVYGLRAGLDRFCEQGCEVASVRLTGGGARSAAWRQMVADIFALPVSVQQVDEGAALGAALQALDLETGGQLQVLVDEHLELDEARGCEPDGAAVEQYAELYADYRRHVAAVSELYS